MRAAFVGLLDRGDPDRPRFSWPGSELRLSFERGERPVARLRTPRVRFRIGLRADSAAAPDRVVELPEGEHLLDLAEGLPEGTRGEASLFLASEPFDRPVELLGLPGGPAPAGLRPLKGGRPLVEFVGDSLTVGYGVVPGCDEDPLDGTDHAQSYASLVSAALGADHRAVARSGKGIVRNWNGGEPDEPFPDLYGFAVPHSGRRIGPGDFPPADLVVLSLGANDFSEPLHAGEKWRSPAELEEDFLENAVRFVLRVRETQGGPVPLLVFVQTGGPDGPETRLWSRAKAALEARGEKGIRLFAHYPPMTGFKGHPTAEAHRATAEALAAEIRRLNLLQAP